MFNKLRRRSSRERRNSKERRGSKDDQGLGLDRSQSLNFDIVDEDKNIEVIFGEEGALISNEFNLKRRGSWSREKKNKILSSMPSLGFSGSTVSIGSVQPVASDPSTLRDRIFEPLHLHPAVSEPSCVLVSSPVRGCFVSRKTSGSVPSTTSPQDNAVAGSKNVSSKPKGRYGSRVEYETKTASRGIRPGRLSSPKKKQVASQISVGSWFPYSPKSSKVTRGTRSRGRKSPKVEQSRKSPIVRTKKLVTPPNNSSDSVAIESNSNSQLLTKLKSKAINIRSYSRSPRKENSGKLANIKSQDSIYVSTPPKSPKRNNRVTQPVEKTSKPKPEVTIKDSNRNTSRKHKPSTFVPYRTPSPPNNRTRKRSKIKRKTPSKSRKQKMQDNLLQKCRIAKPVNREALRKRRAKKRAQDL